MVTSHVRTLFKELAKNRLSGYFPRSTCFLPFYSPLPEAYQIKKSIMLGRGAGVRAETLTMIVVDTIPVD